MLTFPPHFYAAAAGRCDGTRAWLWGVGYFAGKARLQASPQPQRLQVEASAETRRVCASKSRGSATRVCHQLQEAVKRTWFLFRVPGAGRVRRLIPLR